MSKERPLGTMRRSDAGPAERWQSVIDDATLCGPEKLVLLAVLRHRNGDEGCWPGLKTIAALAGFKRRHTQRLLRNLKAKGRLHIVPRAGRSNFFRLAENRELGRGVTQDTGALESTPGCVMEDTPYYIGEHLRITAAQHENLRRAYPSVNLDSEYHRMDVYLDTLKPKQRWKNAYQGARNWCARIRAPQEREKGARREPEARLARFESVGRTVGGNPGRPAL